MVHAGFSCKITKTAQTKKDAPTPPAERCKYPGLACYTTSGGNVERGLPGQQIKTPGICTLNLSRAETSSRWCGVVVSSSGVVHYNGKILRRKSPRDLVRR
ncbi:hypothetical protein TNCV_1187251 [Trichonephila clavipes]|nr:hypothetical protein TNCV_1187251 [Trichonephila clavipes]